VEVVRFYPSSPGDFRRVSYRRSFSTRRASIVETVSLTFGGRREKSIKALLHRHPDAAEEEVSFLTETLKVPLEWIKEAKAAQLASEGNVYEGFLELIKAGLVDRAHRILVGKLVPEAILRDDLVLVRRLCGGLAKKVPDGWEYGGKVGPSFYIALTRPSHLAIRWSRNRVNLGSTLMGGIAVRRLRRHPRRSPPPSWECAPSRDSSRSSRIKQAQRPRQGSPAAFAAPPGVVPGQAGCAANRSIVGHALGAARHCGSAPSRRIRECGRGEFRTWKSDEWLLIRFRADRPTGSPASACGRGQASPTPGGGFRYVQQISQRHLRLGVRRRASSLWKMRLPRYPICSFVTTAQRYAWATIFSDVSEISACFRWQSAHVVAGGRWQVACGNWGMRIGGRCGSIRSIGDIGT
jgi:hypothetical protein